MLIPQGLRRKAANVALQVTALLGLLTIGCGFVPAHAQFIGFVSPQSVQQTLASSTACTGAAQTFTPQNLGQTQHFISITATGTGSFVRAEIDGIDNAGTAYPISDRLRGATNTGSFSVVAYGYFPKIQVSVTCTVGASFTLTYAGASASFGPIVGSYQTGQSDKMIAVSAPSNANFTDTIQTPFANSQGTVYFTYSGTGPTGSTITVTCLGVASTGQSDIFNLPAVPGLASFAFPVPPGTCPSVQITYTSGGASAIVFNLEYAFTQPGSPTGAAVYTPAQLGVNALTEPMAGTTALSQIIDTRGAREATLKAACTAGNYTVNVQTYADDGTTTLALVTPVTAIAAAANVDLSIGSESNPATNTGTLSTTALVRLPQRALAFSFTNAGAAGTCTARLFLTY